MQGTKNTYNSLIGKMIVTKEGKRLGFVRDITFETKSGELINVVVKDSTPYTKNLNLEGQIQTSCLSLTMQLLL
jgi:sporulation protein YlmC with PRC-barrel domain